MTPYYYILDNLSLFLNNLQSINTVTQGDIYEIDLNKQSIYAIAHIMIGDVRPTSNTIQFSVSIIFADIVDESKDANTSNIIDNTNEIDVLNEMLMAGLQTHQHLLRGDFVTDNIMIVGDPTLQPFTDRFENKLAGWTLTFDVQTANNVSIC